MHKIFYLFYASRPKTLVASASPILISSVLCYKVHSFNMIIFVFTITAALLIQIMTNFINDLYDYKKGADTKNSIGPERMIQKGYLSENDILNGIYVVFLLALFLGCYLVSVGGILILSIGLSAFLFAYLYTATRLSIAYNGLGEIFVFCYFGIIASLGTYYLQSLEYNYNALLIGIIIGCLNVNLLVINNLRDLKADKLSNKNTLVVIFGQYFGKIEFILMFVVSFIFLYVLLLSLGSEMIFYRFIPLFIFALFIIYKVFTDLTFLNYKALPVFSIYIILFTLFLMLNIYL